MSAAARFARNIELPRREFQVASLLRRGLSASQAALELGISRDTVKWAIAQVYRRLGIHSREELAAATLVARAPSRRVDVVLQTAVPRRCLTCATELPRRAGRGRRALYCSNPCRRRSPRRDLRACARCRATFRVPADEPTAYCSRRCAWTARPWMSRAPVRRCAWQQCGAAFRPTQPRERFHALECRRAWDADRRRPQPLPLALKGDRE